MSKKIEMLTDTMKMWIHEGHFKGSDILCALHNASVHGEIWLGRHDVDQDVLDKVFNGYEESLAALREIEKS